jgi:chloramphenicol-sensitive protein RarD
VSKSEIQEKPVHVKNVAKGLGLGLTAYLIWGSFPLIITGLASFANPWEIVVWRIVFGFATAVALISVTRSWASLRAVFRNRSMLGWIGLSSVLIMINWQVYVIGIASGRVLETSLGYFINPLVTIVLAVFFLREKLNLVQWMAVALGAVAVTVLSIDYGHLPWVALTLAATFGVYGLAKNKLGGQVTPLNSYAIESGALLPVAIIQGAIVASISPGLQITSQGWQGVAGLAFFGIMTAIPLILFGTAAENLPLSWIGFMQFMTPSIQFVLGLTVFKEQMSPARWVGFILVWLALLVLTSDALKRNQANRKLSS